MELKSVTASVFFSSDVANPDTYSHFYTDIQMYTTTMTQPDPELFMNQFTSWEVASKDNKWQGRNITRWRNEEYDKIYRAAESELDPVKRAALFIKMNEMVIQNVVVIPVVFRPRVAAVSNALRVEQSGWDSDFWNLQNWYQARRSEDCGGRAEPADGMWQVLPPPPADPDSRPGRDQPRPLHDPGAWRRAIRSRSWPPTPTCPPRCA